MNEKYMTACFTGHRPDKLPNNIEEIRRKTKILCLRLIKYFNYRNFISGCANGYDTISFFVIEEIKKEYPELNIQNIIAVPYRKYYSKELKLMKSLANDIIYVDEIKEYNINDLVKVGEYAKVKLIQRNHFMVDKSSFIIGCWDETKGGTYEAITYSKKVKINGVIIKLNKNYEMEDLFA
jgi:uncharacterized phage-like protein YoqJ